MKLGRVMKERRKELGISRAELARRMAKHGFTLPGTTIADWETRRKSSSPEGDPDFLKAMSKSLEIPYLVLLEKLGFPNGLPAEITPEAMAIAQAIVSSPEEMQHMIKLVVTTILSEEGL